MPSYSTADSRMRVGRSLRPDSVMATAATISNMPAIVPDLEPSAYAQRMALQALIDLGTPLVDTLPAEPPRAARTATCTVTVFIPAHNEAASIGATLRSLREQNYPPSNVIVVCDNCTDDTAAIAQRILDHRSLALSQIPDQ